MTDTDTQRWQSAYRAHAHLLDEVIAECRDADPSARLITVMLAPGKFIRAGTRADMDGELRRYGHTRLADYIRDSDDAPDGPFVSALAHVVIMDPVEPPVVGTMTVWIPNAKGGVA